MEPLGRRIAKHRAELGWTQQELAARVAVSRVALSHIESGLTVPGERTVALLAGVFGLDPPELVAGSDYPVAKIDRLPLVAGRYTEVEHQVALLEADEVLADRTGDRSVLEPWPAVLAELRARTHDPRQRALLDVAASRLRA